MNKQSKWLVSASALLAVGTVLGACSSKSETPAAQPSTAPSASATASASPSKAPDDDKSKKFKIEIMKDLGAGAAMPSADKDALRPVFEKELNIDFVLNPVPEYDSKLNVRVAANDFPDAFVLNKQKVDDFSKRGVLLDLAPYKDKLPNLQKYLGNEIFNNGVQNGKMYFIPGLPGQSQRYFTYWIRTDWLAKVGMQPPKTLEELAAVAKAFTLNDPDGNGKQDTYGITGNGLAAFDPIFGAFGVNMGIGDLLQGEFTIKDGALQNSLYAPKMKDALTYINQLIKGGYVDPELVANKSANVRTAAFQGKAGIAFIDWASMMKDEYVQQWKAVNAKAEWAQLEAIQGTGGRSNNVWEVGAGGGGIVLPKSLEKDPAKLNRVLALLDYMGTQKGAYLSQFGIEGVHYNIQNGVVVPTPKLAEEGTYFFLYQMFGRDDKVYLPSKFAKQQPYIDNAFNQPHEMSYTTEVPLPEGYNAADASRYIAEQLVQFAYGKTAIDQYDKFLSNLETTFKYKSFLDGAQKYFKDKGAIK
ncbi:type 2 periplasmic-binding domain-containing protein [Paenibacillus cymbidii]|uniref:extracellular solute-binding protein n=1 Tax=Paenibacillus cymbidii TaxID=1639034 RepID=UPI0010815926|nr:extracellular solute-binding protein [Paenibacillus cymbidii]